MTKDQIAIVMAEFSLNTWTTEFGSAAKELAQAAEQEGLISRHPGILGSRYSYYRTEKGHAVWNELNP